MSDYSPRLCTRTDSWRNLLFNYMPNDLRNLPSCFLESFRVPIAAYPQLLICPHRMRGGSSFMLFLTAFPFHQSFDSGHQVNLRVPTFHYKPTNQTVSSPRGFWRDNSANRTKANKSTNKHTFILILNAQHCPQIDWSLKWIGSGYLEGVNAASLICWNLSTHSLSKDFFFLACYSAKYLAHDTLEIQ